jgi:hypothetical protein
MSVLISIKKVIKWQKSVVLESKLLILTKINVRLSEFSCGLLTSDHQLPSFHQTLPNQTQQRKNKMLFSSPAVNRVPFAVNQLQA